MVYSNFWKLDKIDKIVISFICIIVTIFCVFTTFSQASEEIDFSTSTKIDNLTFGSSDTFYHDNNSQFCCFYLKVNPETKYILNSSQSLVFSTSQELPANLVEFENFSTGIIENREVTGVNYLVVRLLQNTDVFPSDTLKISYELNGLNFAVNSLVNTLTTDYLWSMFKNVVPFIGVTIVVVLGYFLLSKLIKGVSKMKQR